MNAMIQQWFDEGSIADALIGKETYFLPDHTYGEHNRLLIMAELYEWAIKHDCVHEVIQQYERTILDLIEKNEIQIVMDLLWTYIVLNHHKKISKLVIDTGKIDAAVIELINRNASMLSCNELLRKKTCCVAGYFPKLGTEIGIPKADPDDWMNEYPPSLRAALRERRV